MLSIQGKPYRHCDGLTRRQFLTAGALTMGGLTLVDLLRAEAAAGIRGSHKAVINIHLDGGPPHMDMIDLKPQAPVEIRGEFTGISTALPGYRDLRADAASGGPGGSRWSSFARSSAPPALTTPFSASRASTRRTCSRSAAVRRWAASSPSCAATASDVAPSFVDLMQGRPFVRNSARPGFLGPTYQPFRPDISQAL